MLVLIFIGIAPFPGFLLACQSDGPVRGSFAKPIGLATPHCAAGLGVGLDLHWDCSFPWDFCSPVSLIARFRACSRNVGLATPHCAAGFGVGLDLHWEVSFLRNLFCFIQLAP